MSDFDAALAYVLDNEGIDSDHPADHGGRTRYGITEALARKYGFDVRALTLDQARTIYLEAFWQPLQALDPWPRLRAKVFDTSVNVGVGTAVRMLQRSLGVTVDMHIGPNTLRAIRAVANASDEFDDSPEYEDILSRFRLQQLLHYARLCKKDITQLAFLEGWIVRANREPK